MTRASHMPVPAEPSAAARRRRFSIVAAGAAGVLTMVLAGTVSLADSAGVVGAMTFPAKTGEEVYNTVCQGCHMAGGKGAVGAGAYPALEDDYGLDSAAGPINIILYGEKGMPGFGGFLSDQQVADVTNYIRTNFGNDYPDKVTAEDVKKRRKPDAIYYTLD